MFGPLTFFYPQSFTHILVAHGPNPFCPQIVQPYTFQPQTCCPYIHPASRGVAAHTAGLFWIVTHIYIHTHIYIYGFVTMFSWNCPWSSAAGQLKHRYYKKSFQDIVFHSVYTIFPVKNTVIYTLCPQKSIQNTSFCSVFNTLASKNLSKYR